MGDIPPLKVNSRRSDAPVGVERCLRSTECAGCATILSSFRWGRGTTRPKGASEEFGIELWS